MRLATAKKIAKCKTVKDVADWSRGVAKFADTIHPQVTAAMRTACNSCPFRESRAVGGCITVDCPINALVHELNLTAKRGAAAAKMIYREL